MVSMKVIAAVVIAFCLFVGIAEAADRGALKEITATIINHNGYLCAEVVDIKPLKVRPDTYEVTCIEYRGGSGTKIYIMDAAKGTAWMP